MFSETLSSPEQPSEYDRISGAGECGIGVPFGGRKSLSENVLRRVFPGEDVVEKGIQSKKTEHFRCRAQAIGNTGTMALCRRANRPYSVQYNKNDQKAYCLPDDDVGIKWCKFLTSKQEEPYIFN